MNILVTAGNTQVPIDRVRCMTNVFTGRTGTGIALYAHQRGHAVTLLTSHPEVVSHLSRHAPAEATWHCFAYRTFADLESLLADHVTSGNFDAIIHCAAVSDYRAAGIFAPAEGTRFDTETGSWQAADAAEKPAMLDREAAKVKSDEPELWLRLVRTSKLVDLIRSDWRFTGTLVKFKLEVDISVERLLEIAEDSRRKSQADWMVANILSDDLSAAFLGPFPGAGYRQIERTDLPAQLLRVLEEFPGRRADA